MDLRNKYENIADTAHLNEQAISKSSLCGCYDCLMLFPATQVTKFISSTATCPYCYKACVLCDYQHPILNLDFLKNVNFYTKIK
jgi:hypothetical protein